LPFLWTRIYILCPILIIGNLIGCYISGIRVVQSVIQIGDYEKLSLFDDGKNLAINFSIGLAAVLLLIRDWGKRNDLLNDIAIEVGEKEEESSEIAETAEQPTPAKSKKQVKRAKREKKKKANQETNRAKKAREESEQAKAEDEKEESKVGEA